MRSTLRKFIIFIVMLSGTSAYSQDLRKVAPVTLPPAVTKIAALPDSLSFALTTLDNNLYKHKPLKYSSAIEIIDANDPWPPRWYVLHSSDTSEVSRPNMMLMLNASTDDKHFSFFTMVENKDKRAELAVLTCDRNMQPFDTFFAYHKMMDGHDFLSSPDHEIAYFAIHDTIVDLRQAYGNPDESLMHMVYQTIEIAAADGKSFFSWSPLSVLGFDAIYLPYRYTQGVRVNHTSFDWSHGNSLHYDYDGNILYSFKHIGIGKISRTDGHVIWHIDRNKQRINPQSDSLPIFLQHDLQAVRDQQGHITYTVLSNGDSLHPHCKGYQFTVDPDASGIPVVKLIKTVTPSEEIPNTGGGGNMDMDADGSYLMNYGFFSQDSTLPVRRLFEYKDAKSRHAQSYDISSSIFSFRAHRMRGWRPIRPVIHADHGQLVTDSPGKGVKWYQLSGDGLRTVRYLGEGQTYTPSEEGFYCAATRYGIGWSVSRAFKFTK